MCEAYPSTKTFNSNLKDLKILTAMSFTFSVSKFLSLSDGSLRSRSCLFVLNLFLINPLVLSINLSYENLL